MLRVNQQMKGREKYGRRMDVWALLGVMLVAAAPLLAQVARDTAVELSATTQTSPPGIALSWKPLTASSSTTELDHRIYRRFPGATNWGDAVATLGGTNVSWTDTTVSTGTVYEYRVIRRFATTNPSNLETNWSVFGYCWAGIEVPLVEERGAIVLVVDNQIASPLDYEISRLTQDLIGDGWRVRRLDVARTATPPDIRSLIQAEWAADTNVQSVLLLGSVPVPYSGNVAPDGHNNHEGAWPADGYYGELDGTWTDTTVSNTVASDSRNDNIPGDGKFDQDEFPSLVELQVGRVDLSDMTSFKVGTETASQQEIRLLRRYLDRNHAWRQAGEAVPARALVDDEFGVDQIGDAYANSGWRNGSALVGWTQNSALNWITTLGTNSYLYAYGCGAGNWSSASGIGTSSSFATNGSRAVFTAFYGSYFGDWDHSDSFLRAPLAAPGLGLTCVWDANPKWAMHPMGMGQTAGYAAKLSMNNRGIVYDYITTDSFLFEQFTPFSTPRECYMGLMGDPSLRLHPVSPPTGVVATGGNLNSNAVLQWAHAANRSDTNFLGYHMYRAPSLTGAFTRLTTELITTNTWTDASPPTNAVYQVRTVARTVGNTGSYINSSQGAFCPWSLANISNQAPEVSAATVTPSPVTGVTAVVTATASDDAGEPGLAYVWTAVSEPPYVDDPSFTPNGANTARTSTITFSQAGNYTVRVTATDAGGMMASRDLSFTVNQTPSSLANITPATAFIAPGATQTFTTAVFDQFAKTMTTTATWTVSGGGSISSGGVFTAGATPGGPYTVTASIGATSTTAQVTVQDPSNQAPTVTSVTINPSPITGTTGTVSAVATDDGGESVLKYTWSTASKPSGSVAAGFSPNNNNAAKTSKVTFTSGGNYTLRVIVTDALNLKSTNDLPVTVNKTPTTVKVFPNTGVLDIWVGTSTEIAYQVNDQFNLVMSTNLTWTTSGGGSISSNGVFTPGLYPGGPHTVTGSVGALFDTVEVTIWDGFSDWLVNYWGIPYSDALVDSDGDGMDNLMEYALYESCPVGTNDTAPWPVPQFTQVGGSNYFTLGYWHLPSHENITMLVEVADSVMGPWSSATNDVEQRWQVNFSDPYEYITARDRKPTEACTTRFMRLKVSNP